MRRKITTTFWHSKAFLRFFAFSVFKTASWHLLLSAIQGIVVQLWAILPYDGLNLIEAFLEPHPHHGIGQAETSIKTRHAKHKRFTHDSQSLIVGRKDNIFFNHTTLCDTNLCDTTLCKHNTPYNMISVEIVWNREGLARRTNVKSTNLLATAKMETKLTLYVVVRT